MDRVPQTLSCADACDALLVSWLSPDGATGHRSVHILQQDAFRNTVPFFIISMCRITLTVAMSHMCSLRITPG